MSLPGVDAVVRARLGLDPESLGENALPRATERRMQARGAATTDEYLALITAEAGERDSLAAELVVPETWFFRGGRALFDALAKFILDRATNRTPGAQVRALSVPCSTGEEPISLAIALHQHRIPPAAYRIEGIDLSDAHLARARAGSYSAFAFRDDGPDIRQTYFQQVGNRWEVRAPVHENVQYRTGNATDLNFLADVPPFDLILCRNLFIYLTGEARLRVMANFERLLAADGWLVLSPAEADRLPPNRFATSGPPELGIYRRAGTSGTVSPIQNSGPTSARKPLSRPVPVSPHQRIRRTEKLASVSSSEPVVVPPSLETARELADAGQLTAARAACERLLAQSAGNADTYSLLGVIFLAERRPVDAAEVFRKALYLNPNHREALEHMIVLCESKGDANQAAALRKRLTRINAEEPT